MTSNNYHKLLLPVVHLALLILLTAGCSYDLHPGRITYLKIEEGDYVCGFVSAGSATTPDLIGVGWTDEKPSQSYPTNIFRCSGDAVQLRRVAIDTVLIIYSGRTIYDQVWESKGIHFIYRYMTSAEGRQSGTVTTGAQ